MIKLLAFAVVALFFANVSAQETNPLLKPWKGEHGGLPNYAEVQLSDVRPGMLEAIEMSRQEHLAIANNKAPATFENTIQALDHAGLTLDRARVYLEVWEGVKVTDDAMDIVQEISLKQSQLGNEIIMNEALFKRVSTVYHSEEFKSLTPEQQRLTEDTYRSFAQNGGELSQQEKEEVSKINEELAILTTRFGQNVSKDDRAFVIATKDEVEGIPDSVLAAAAEKARSEGEDGKFLFKGNRTDVAIVTESASNRALRKRIFELFMSRGNRPGESNNLAIQNEIIALRDREARIFKNSRGENYPSYAHWVLDGNRILKTPDQVREFLLSMLEPALKKFPRLLAQMQELATADGVKKIEPYDFKFYLSKLKEKKFGFTQTQLRPYLKVDNVIAAMFEVANRLFGLKFQRKMDAQVYDPSVEVYEVSDRQGEFVSYWIFDPYSRDFKSNGAWMSPTRSQGRVNGEIVYPVVQNVLNILKPAAGGPTLVTFDDVTTMFHEFGHGLHGMLSNVEYRTLSGVNVALDLVELPSQFMEEYALTDMVLNHFTNEQGEKIPAQWIEGLRNMSDLTGVVQVINSVGPSMVDLGLHSAEHVDPVDVEKFEKDILAQLAIPVEQPLGRSFHFTHFMASSMYAAGYYSYLYDQALVSEVSAVFNRAGGLYDSATGDRFRDLILSKGNSVDPAEAVENFLGRKPNCEALLEDFRIHSK